MASFISNYVSVFIYLVTI